MQKLQAKAEIILVLHKMSIKDSFKSFDELADALRAAIPDSKILEKVSLGRLKAAILVREAIGPYFKRKMLSTMNENNYYTVLFDETPNDIGKTELQVSIRFFSTETEQVTMIASDKLISLLNHRKYKSFG